MEAKFAMSLAGDQIINYGVDRMPDSVRHEIPAHSTSDALTVPTRRQMNSVKNQFEGNIF